MKFHDLSLRHKTVTLMLATSVSVLLLACSLLIVFEFFTVRARMRRQMTSLAEIIAANSAVTVDLDDAEFAGQVLASLKGEPDVLAAALYKLDGQLLASFPPDSDPGELVPLQEDRGVYPGWWDLRIFEPIAHGTRRVGTLYLQADFTSLYWRFGEYGLIVLLVMAGSSVVAVFVSNILQAKISGPILELARISKTVSETDDYSLRVQPQTSDELGQLSAAFNNMLLQIHSRDQALRQARDQLNQYARDLESRVEERTARLSETVRELESFSYSISHDMRAPLRAMQGYSDFVLENYGNHLGDGREYLERIRRAGNRLDALIQDILTYSRISREAIQLVPVDLEQIVADVIDQYPLPDPVGAAVEVQKPLLKAVGHEASLTQVFANLLSNAAKFRHPERNPRIKIWTESIGPDVRCFVQDNGIGIPAKDLTRIFSIFERIHADHQYEGTGIGLSIVRKAVERMGGTVGLNSELGNGSTFWFQLKRA